MAMMASRSRASMSLMEGHGLGQRRGHLAKGLVIKGGKGQEQNEEGQQQGHTIAEGHHPFWCIHRHSLQVGFLLAHAIPAP